MEKSHHCSLTQLLLLGFILIASCPLSAGSLVVVADYASFCDQETGRTYIEIYYALNRHQLGFIGDTGSAKLYAGVLVTAHAAGQDGVAIDSASAYFLSGVSDSTEMKRTGIRLFDYLQLNIGPGTYTVAVYATDNVSKLSGSTNLMIFVPIFSPERLTSSDLELAYDIREINDSTEPSYPRLVKEEREVIPNPGRVFSGEAGGYLFAYSELYGLSAPATGSRGMTVQYYLKDVTGAIVSDYGLNQFEKPGQSAVLSNRLSISAVPTGKYYLSLVATDMDTGEEALSVKPLYIMSGVSGDSALPHDSDRVVNIAYYHLGEAEKMQIKQLDAPGKRAFIRQFWRSQDPDPGTPENRMYNEATRRFDHANEYFSTRSDTADGWQTDRGRVYIVYGPPDDQEDVVMTGKRFPYLLWRYHQLEGGVIFMFVSDFKVGISDYRLVHSTHPRERYDPAWQKYLDDGAEIDDERR